MTRDQLKELIRIIAGICAQRGLNRTDTDDVVQCCLLDLHRQGRLNPAILQEPRKYLNAMVRNKCIDVYRKRQRVEVEVGEDMTDLAIDIEWSIIRSALKKHLHEYIDKLPEDERRLITFELEYLAMEPPSKGGKWPFLSERMGLPEKECKAIWKRAHRRLGNMVKSSPEYKAYIIVRDNMGEG